jgi:hypothetical protein
MRDPIPAHEVDLIEGHAAPAPRMRASADDAITNQPLIHDPRSADALNLVQSIGIFLAFETATLENRHSQAAI